MQLYLKFKPIICFKTNFVKYFMGKQHLHPALGQHKKKHPAVLFPRAKQGPLSQLSLFLNKFYQFLVEFVTLIIKQSVAAIFKWYQSGVLYTFMLGDSQGEQTNLIMNAMKD